MNKVSLEIVSKPFQALFADWEFHFRKAEEWQTILVRAKDEEGESFDPVIGWTLRSYCRACVVSGVAGVEAFCNWVLAKHGNRRHDEIPAEWLGFTEVDKIPKTERWPLKMKVRLLPTLCNNSLRAPRFYWGCIEDKFNVFCELVKVRNSVAHGRTCVIKYEIRDRHGRIQNVNDSPFPENFFPLTGISKDTFGITFQAATIAHTNIIAVMRTLLLALDVKLTARDLTQQSGKAGDLELIITREATEPTTPHWYHLFRGRGP